MDFNTIYYISGPISEDEFAEKVRLWRTQRQAEDDDLMRAYAYYVDDDYADATGNDDDIWIPRRQRQINGTRPSSTAHCIRETVLQRRWQARGNPIYYYIDF